MRRICLPRREMGGQQADGPGEHGTDWTHADFPTSDRVPRHSQLPREVFLTEAEPEPETPQLLARQLAEG